MRGATAQGYGCVDRVVRWWLGSWVMTSADPALALIDLDRYPVDDPTSEVLATVIATGRAQLAESGYAELPAFVTPAAIEALVADAAAHAPRAHRSTGPGTAYLELPDEEAFAENHPRRRWMPYDVGAVAYDLIGLDSPLRAVYESDAVLGLVEAILDRGQIYRYADPFGALNLAVMGEGDQLQWHFDQTDFVVSLAVQSAAEGGAFEVVPKVRSDHEEHYDIVERVLEGDATGIVTLPMVPGTLLVFEGRRSLHRVSPIAGSVLRHVGLLGYDTAPGTQSSELLRAIRYGRTMPHDVPPNHWPAA